MTEVGTPPVNGPISPSPRETLEKRISLSRFLTPGFQQANPDDFTDVTDAMTDWMAPDNLRQYLVGVRRGTPRSVYYVPEGSSGFVHIALTARDNSDLLIAPRQFGQKVADIERGRRPERGDFEVDEAAAERKGRGAVADRLERMQKHLSYLTQQAATIAIFHQAAKYPGRSIIGTEMSTRIQYTDLETNIFGDILKILRHQRGWTPEKQELAARALFKRIVLMRAKSQHIGNFRGHITLAGSSNYHRQGAYRHFIQQAESHLSDTAPKIIV